MKAIHNDDINLIVIASHWFKPLPSWSPGMPVERWKRFVIELRRLAYKRRKWAHLGRWLNAIKRGIRMQEDRELESWWTGL